MVNYNLGSRPVLYNPQSLRRWRASLGGALLGTVPVVCVGDSITAGQGGDGNTGSYSNVPDNTDGWAGQLRTLWGNELASAAGEGFWFSDDSRVTVAGSPTQNSWACVPLRHGYRLIGSTQTLQVTVPAGVTVCSVIQANQNAAFSAGGTGLADVSAIYSQTGSHTVTNQAIASLTNTGRAVVTDIACAAGDTITVKGPASAQSYIVGFVMKTGSPGVLVHRIGQPGYVSGDLLGGQTSGVLTQAASATFQLDACRAVYDWAGTQGLVIVSFEVNDQAGQAGTGAAGGVTLALYTAWMEQFCNQAVADGWCCLILGEPRNPNAYAGGASEDQYYAAVKAFALATDHVAFLDTGELWGSAAAAQALGLAVNTSVHPTQAGHGDMARMVWHAVGATAGISALAAA